MVVKSPGWLWTQADLGSLFGMFGKTFCTPPTPTPAQPGLALLIC